MAVKQFYHDIDLVNGQFLNARIHNVSNSGEATLAGALSAAEAGFQIYNTDIGALKIWNGVTFDQVAASVAGDVVFYGVVTDLSSSGNPPTEAAGAQYVVGAVSGTLAWTGITFNPTAEVEEGDVILYTSATEAYILQRNDVYASETTAGNIRLATQAEVITGAVTDEAVTPATLAGWSTTNAFAKVYTATVSLADNTAFTVNHGLALANKDAFVINVMDSSGSQISVDVDSVDSNNLTLTARPAVANVIVTIIGF